MILAVLLEIFKLRLSEKEIIWDQSGVAFPSTMARKEPSRPAMPLRVRFVRTTNTLD